MPTVSGRWKYRLKELFTFTKRERIGFAVLLGMVLFVLFYPILFSPKSAEEISPEGFEILVDTREDSGDSANVEIELFDFDPNSADSVTLLKLGFSPKQARSILKYRSKGGKFKSPYDFSKLYVVSEEQYLRLEPYIKIKEQRKAMVRKVELNTADTIELQRLKGVGPYYARQIARYREHLGGFYHIDQLKEIKGIDDERFLGFINQCTLNTSLISQLKVNHASEQQLKLHPYVGNRAAKKIISYRQSAKIDSVIQLVNVGILTQDGAQRLALYLSFD